MPSSVTQAEGTSAAAAVSTGRCADRARAKCYPYRGGGRQDDVSDGGFELVDVGPVLMRAVVGLDGLDLHVELPGLVFVLGVAGRVEGVVFGM